MTPMRDIADGSVARRFQSRMGKESIQCILAPEKQVVPISICYSSRVDRDNESRSSLRLDIDKDRAAFDLRLPQNLDPCARLARHMGPQISPEPSNKATLTPITQLT